MQTLVFHLDTDQIGANLGDSIKAYFGHRKVQITVQPEATLSEIIAANRTADHEYVIPYQDLSRLADALDRDEPVDVVAEINTFRADKP
jgi:hypothetical protein